MRRIERHYAPVPSSCRDVRRDLRTMLDHAEVDDELAQNATLVVNELVSNVIDHVGTPFVVVVSLASDTLTVEVTDGSSELPVVRPHDVTARRGRGMQLVEELSDRWFSTALASGKTITAILAVPAAG